MKEFCDIGGILEWNGLAMPRWDGDIWKKIRKRWKNKPCTYQWEGVQGKGKKLLQRLGGKSMTRMF